MLPYDVLHVVSQHLSLVLLKVTEEELGLEGLRMRQYGLYLMGVRRQMSSQGCRAHRQDAAVSGSPGLLCKESRKAECIIVGNGGSEPPPCAREAETEGKGEAMLLVLETVLPVLELVLPVLVDMGGGHA